MKEHLNLKMVLIVVVVADAVRMLMIDQRRHSVAHAARSEQRT